MKTGFLCLFASPGVLLLATTTLIPTGGIAATTDAADGLLEDEAATTYEIADECSAEIDACGADETCSSCISASSNNDERLACHTFFTSTSSTFGCETNMESACCLDNLNDLECLGNQSFLEYYGCILEGLGCSGELTCDDTSSTRATATHTSLGYASTVVVVGLTCAFVVLSPLM